jgi:perosamine synthetase
MFDDFVGMVREWYQTDKGIPLHAPCIGAHDKELVNDALDSTYVSSVGVYVDRFESDLANYMGVGRAVAVVNGTSALQVALRLVGVRENDEVITQPLTFVATANAIAYNHAHPVFLDVEKQTLGLSPAALRQFLTDHAEKGDDITINRTTGRRIGAILPVHTFGLPCRIDALCDIASEWNIPVVEDAAESLGSTHKGQHCGTFGAVGIVSFNGNKIITSGGGGAIVTHKTELADRAKHLTTTAKKPHRWAFDHDEIGYNFRMPNLNAALACSQLDRIDNFLGDKQKLCAAYTEFFADKPWATYVQGMAESESNHWLNTILLPDRATRDAFLEATNDAGIMTRPTWMLMNDLAMYKDCLKGDLKEAKWLQDRLVNIPSSAGTL